MKEKIYYSSNVESFVEAITMSSVTEVLQNIFLKDSNNQEVNVGWLHCIEFTRFVAPQDS